MRNINRGMLKQALTRVQVAIIAIVILVAAIAGIAYYVITLTPTPSTPKEFVVFGYVDHFTGIFAAGVQGDNLPPITLIVEDYNAKGGLYIPEYGRKLPIKVIQYDSKSDIETLIRLTEKCMIEDHVDYMFPPWGTAYNFAVIPLYEKYKYPLIAITMGSDQVVRMIREEGKHWIFPVLGQPSFQASKVADFLEWAMPQVDAKNIGIIYVNDLHGIEFASAFYREISLRGKYSIAVYEGYPLGVSDLSPLIKKIKEANVDVLIACSYPEDGVLLIRQCMEYKYNPKIMIDGPGVVLPSVLLPNFGTDAIKGLIYYHGSVASYTATPKLKEFCSKFYERFGFYPHTAQVAQYSALECLFKAIEKYGLDREKVRDALSKEKIETTYLGSTWFNLEEVHLDSPLLGSLAQWQGGVTMEVIWPLDKKSADWIPKPPWP